MLEIYLKYRRCTYTGDNKWKFADFATSNRRKEVQYIYRYK